MNDVYIHPAAIVDTDQIGAGTRIWAFTHIMQGVSIGKDCNIGEHCFVESGVVIGANVTIKNGNMVWEGVTLEDGVFIGPNVSFTNDLYPRSPRLRQAHARYSDRRWLVRTLVKRGASLGAGAVILAGVVVGEYSMVGAGAVVTRDVHPYALVAGNPARVKGWVCQCGQPLEWKAEIVTCSSCGLDLVRYDDAGDMAGTEVNVAAL
jgi:UDP-2-acetamido-3-amino-2,3-dideoxy-glucuronate N-acetyltransferase